MNKPETYQDWAEESLSAYEVAHKELLEGTSPVASKFELFRHAPILASINRNINGTDRGIEMLSVINNIERDFEIDDEAKDRYLFNFVFSYIHSHIYSELLEDMEADRIMDYINENFELFENV